MAVPLKTPSPIGETYPIQKSSVHTLLHEASKDDTIASNASPIPDEEVLICSPIPLDVEEPKPELIVTEVGSQTGRSLVLSPEKQVTIDVQTDRTTEKPLAIAVQTDKEVWPPAESQKGQIQVLQRVDGDEETIEIATKSNFRGETYPMQTLDSTTPPDDLTVEVKYKGKKGPEGTEGTGSISELNILHTGPQSFETMVIEPGDTSTEVIVDADGTKRIIVKKVRRTVVSHHERLMSSEIRTVDGGNTKPLAFSQVSLHQQQRSVAHTQPDGKTEITSSQAFSGQVASGIEGGEITTSEFSTQPEHQTITYQGMPSDVVLHEFPQDVQKTDFVTQDGSGNWITTTSSVRAVVQQVSRRIIRRTRRIIKKNIVIIDGKEHVTEEVIEEPEEVEVTEDEIPRVSIEISADGHREGIVQEPIEDHSLPSEQSVEISEILSEEIQPFSDSVKLIPSADVEESADIFVLSPDSFSKQETRVDVKQQPLDVSDFAFVKHLPQTDDKSTTESISIKESISKPPVDEHDKNLNLMFIEAESIYSPPPKSVKETFEIDIVSKIKEPFEEKPSDELVKEEKQISSVPVVISVESKESLSPKDSPNQVLVESEKSIDDLGKDLVLQTTEDQILPTSIPKMTSIKESLPEQSRILVEEINATEISSNEMPVEKLRHDVILSPEKLTQYIHIESKQISPETSEAVIEKTTVPISKLEQPIQKVEEIVAKNVDIVKPIADKVEEEKPTIPTRVDIALSPILLQSDSVSSATEEELPVLSKKEKKKKDKDKKEKEKREKEKKEKEKKKNVEPSSPKVNDLTQMENKKVVHSITSDVERPVTSELMFFGPGKVAEMNLEPDTFLNLKQFIESEKTTSPINNKEEIPELSKSTFEQVVSVIPSAIGTTVSPIEQLVKSDVTKQVPKTQDITSTKLNIHLTEMSSELEKPKDNETKSIIDKPLLDSTTLKIQFDNETPYEVIETVLDKTPKNKTTLDIQIERKPVLEEPLDNLVLKQPSPEVKVETLVKSPAVVEENILSEVQQTVDVISPSSKTVESQILKENLQETLIKPVIDEAEARVQETLAISEKTNIPSEILELEASLKKPITDPSKVAVNNIEISVAVGKTSSKFKQDPKVASSVKIEKKKTKESIVVSPTMEVVKQEADIVLPGPVEVTKFIEAEKEIPVSPKSTSSKGSKKKKQKEGKDSSPEDLSVVTSLADSMEIVIPGSQSSSDTTKPTEQEINIDEITSPRSIVSQHDESIDSHDAGYEAEDKTTVDDSSVIDDNTDLVKIKKKKKKKQKIKLKDHDAELTVDPKSSEDLPSVTLEEDNVVSVGKKKESKKLKGKKSDKKIKTKSSSEDDVHIAETADENISEGSARDLSDKSPNGIVKVIEESVPSEPQSEHAIDLHSQKVVTYVPVFELIPKQDESAQTVTPDKEETIPIETSDSSAQTRKTETEEIFIQTSPEVQEKPEVFSVQIDTKELITTLEDSVQTTPPVIKSPIETLDSVSQTTIFEPIPTHEEEMQTDEVLPLIADNIETSMQTDVQEFDTHEEDVQTSPEPAMITSTQGTQSEFIVTEEGYSQTSPREITTTEFSVQTELIPTEKDINQVTEELEEINTQIGFSQTSPREIFTTELSVQTISMELTPTKEDSVQVNPEPLDTQIGYSQTTPREISTTDLSVQTVVKELVPTQDSFVQAVLEPVEKTKPFIFEDQTKTSSEKPKPVLKEKAVVPVQVSDTTVQTSPVNISEKKYEPIQQPPSSNEPFRVQIEATISYSHPDDSDTSYTPRDGSESVSSKSEVIFENDSVPQKALENVVSPETDSDQSWHSHKVILDQKKIKKPKQKNQQVDSKNLESVKTVGIIKDEEFTTEEKLITPKENIEKQQSTKDPEVKAKVTFEIDEFTQEIQPQITTEIANDRHTSTVFIQSELQPRVISSHEILSESSPGFSQIVEIEMSSTPDKPEDSKPLKKHKKRKVKHRADTTALTFIVPDTEELKEEYSLEVEDSPQAFIAAEKDRPESALKIEEVIIPEDKKEHDVITGSTDTDVLKLNLGSDDTTQMTDSNVSDFALDSPSVSDFDSVTKTIIKSEPKIEDAFLDSDKSLDKKPNKSKKKGKNKQPKIENENKMFITREISEKFTPKDKTLDKLSDDFIAREVHVSPREPLQPVEESLNIQWKQVGNLVSDRLKNLQNASRTTHIIYLTSLEPEEVTTQERTEQLEENLENLQAAFKTQDIVVIQRTVIITVETISTWLETIEYRIQQAKVSHFTIITY